MYNTIMIIVNVVLSIAIYFSLTACGFQPPEEQTVSKVSSEQKQKDTEESSSKDEEEAEEEQELFDFEASTVPGYYKTSCLSENGYYLKYDLEITENETVYMAIYQFAYNDINCNFSAVASTYRKFYANFLDEKNVNFTVEATLLTYYTQGETLIANYMKIYGFTDWVRDVPKDVTGLRVSSGVTDAEHTKGTVLYLTYSSTDSLFKLSPPADSTGEKATSPENRTRKLDDRRFVKVK